MGDHKTVNDAIVANLRGAPHVALAGRELFRDGHGTANFITGAQASDLLEQIAAAIIGKVHDGSAALAKALRWAVWIYLTQAHAGMWFVGGADEQFPPAPHEALHIFPHAAMRAAALKLAALKIPDQGLLSLNTRWWQSVAALCRQVSSRKGTVMVCCARAKGAPAFPWTSFAFRRLTGMPMQPEDKALLKSEELNGGWPAAATLLWVTGGPELAELDPFWRIPKKALASAPIRISAADQVPHLGTTVSVQRLGDGGWLSSMRPAPALINEPDIAWWIEADADAKAVAVGRDPNAASPKLGKSGPTTVLGSVAAGPAVQRPAA